MVEGYRHSLPLVECVFSLSLSLSLSLGLFLLFYDGVSTSSWPTGGRIWSRRTGSGSIGPATHLTGPRTTDQERTTFSRRVHSFSVRRCRRARARAHTHTHLPYQLANYGHPFYGWFCVGLYLERKGKRPPLLARVSWAISFTVHLSVVFRFRRENEKWKVLRVSLDGRLGRKSTFAASSARFPFFFLFCVSWSSSSSSWYPQFHWKRYPWPYNVCVSAADFWRVSPGYQWV